MVKFTMKILESWIPSCLCAGIIAYASLYPYGDIGLIWRADDWIQHGLAYLALSLLMWFPLAVTKSEMGLKKRALRIIIVCTSFGILMEIGQFLSPGRTPSVIDALVNLIGASIGQIPFLLVRRK